MQYEGALLLVPLLLEKQKIKNTFSFFPWMKKKESELAIAQHCINIRTRIGPPWRWHRVELLFTTSGWWMETIRRRCMYKYEREETRKRSMAFASVNGLTWWTGDLIRRGSNHCTIPKGVDINIRKLNMLDKHAVGSFVCVCLKHARPGLPQTR